MDDKSGQKLIPGQRIADYTGISVPRRWREEDPKFKVTVSCTVIYILSYTQRQRQEYQKFKIVFSDLLSLRPPWVTWDSV